jgi:hypothetical protein
MISSGCDTIGQGYHSHRKADPRITRSIVDLLATPCCSMIADIGASPENCSRALADFGFQVKAIVMLNYHPRFRKYIVLTRTKPKTTPTANIVNVVSIFVHLTV